MKKLLASLLIMCIAFSSSVFAYDLDLSSLSDEEILQLKADVNSVIKERGIQEAKTLPTGKYVIGKDVVAGSYTFSLPEDSEPDSSVYAFLYDTEEAFESLKAKDMWYVTKDQPAFFSLEEGLILLVQPSKVDITPAE